MDAVHLLSIGCLANLAGQLTLVPMANERFSSSGFSSGWAYAGLGFEFVGLFLACTAGGWWLDEKFWPRAGSPAMLIGLFLGFGVGLYHVLYRTRQIQNKQAERSQQQSSQQTDSRRMDQLEEGIDDVARRIDHFVDQERDLRERKQRGRQNTQAPASSAKKKDKPFGKVEAEPETDAPESDRKDGPAP